MYTTKDKKLHCCLQNKDFRIFISDFWNPWCKYILTYCLYRALTKLAVANFELPPPPQIDLNTFFSFFGRFQNPFFLDAGRADNILNQNLHTQNA
jgi:hypothetical protein